MNKDELKQALYGKMSEEQDAFRSWLLEQPPEEILNHTYEYTAREDILMAMDFLDLSAPQAAALLESPSPLADLCKDFRNMETGLLDNLEECIKDRADRLLESRQEGKIPIYPHDRKYAMEHGELKQCRASYDENVACKEAIEKAINEGFDGYYLSGSVAKDVLNSFSADRVSYVLAATLQEKQHDGRFSRSNKEWAETVPVHDAAGERLGYIVQSHPAVLDGFINLARQEMKTMREQPEKKPSIRAQLAQKPEKPRQEGLEQQAQQRNQQNQNKGEASL